MKDLSDGRDVDLTGRIIDGNIDVDQISGAAQDDRRTSMRVIRGRLRLDSCRVTGRVSMPRTILADIVLTCGEVLGDIDLSDSEVRGGVVLDNERIVGGLRLARTRMERDLTLKNAILDDSLEISGASLHSVSMGGAELRRGFEISNSVVGGVDFTGAKIAGSIKLSEVLLLSGMSGVNATFERGMTVDGCRSKGSLSMSGATGQGGLILSNLTVEGHLMPPLSLEGPLAMNEVTIYQNLLMVDGRFAEATINKVMVAGSSEFTGVHFGGKLVISDTDFGRAFSATEAVFDGAVELRKVRFPGDNPMEGALFASAPTLVDTTLPHPPQLKTDANEEGVDGGELDEEDDPGPGGD